MTTPPRAAAPTAPGHRFARAIGRWALRIAIAIFLLVALCAASGAVYQMVATRRDATRFRPPGRMVDVGGHRLDLVCAGRGEPTVVLDGPVGASHLVWMRVQPAIAAFARVCSYDRAGFGWSEPDDQPRTNERMATELHTLVQRAGERGPFVLVGNSLGGVNARIFALRFPDEVAGMVLLDSGHEDQFARLPPSAGVTPQERRTLGILRVAVRLGLLRLNGVALGEGSSDQLPDSLRPAARAMGFRTAWVDAVRNEVLNAVQGYAEARDAIARGPKPLLGDRPLVVLVRDPDDEQFRRDPSVRTVWMDLQRELAASSTRGTLRTVEGSGHFVEVDRPQAVIDAVREVVEAGRGQATARELRNR
jgi:pimeloyl-ACP methyl ester carboxylesterase